MPPCMGGAPWNADAWGVSWCGGSSACAAGRLHGAAAVSMLRRQPPPRSGSVRWARLGSLGHGNFSLKSTTVLGLDLEIFTYRGLWPILVGPST